MEERPCAVLLKFPGTNCDSETARALEGESAHIMAKMNSLQDLDMIEALYRASSAGVKIQLNIRGICCLKTGKRKEAKNIRVVSIVDRFLEHARIFYFHHGGDPEVLISSADWMKRNLDKRVELMNIALRKRQIRLAQLARREAQHNVQVPLARHGVERRLEPRASLARLPGDPGSQQINWLIGHGRLPSWL